MIPKVQKRRAEIMNIVNIEGKAYGNELSKMFGVTTETIRADLDFIGMQEGYIRIHGGITKEETEHFNMQYKYLERQTNYVEAKKKICYHTMDLIEDNDCIYVDTGSTVTFLLHYINRRKNITLVTPSIALLMKYITENYTQVFLNQGHTFIFIGGEVDANILTTYGTFFHQTVEDFNFDKMIFSVDGIDYKKGCTDVDYASYGMMKSVSKKANKKIAIMDKSKFGRVAAHHVIGWDSMDYLVTDYALDHKWKSLLKQKNITYKQV